MLLFDEQKLTASRTLTALSVDYCERVVGKRSVTIRAPDMPIFDRGENVPRLCRRSPEPVVTPTSHHSPNTIKKKKVIEEKRKRKLKAPTSTSPFLKKNSISSLRIAAPRLIPYIHKNSCKRTRDRSDKR